MPVDDYGGRRLIRLHYNHHNNHRFTAIIHNREREREREREYLFASQYNTNVQK